MTAQPFLPQQEGRPGTPVLRHGATCKLQRCLSLTPHCFRGPITICTGDDKISLSPALDEYASLISDVLGLHVYFVGTRPRSRKWGNGSSGSDNGESVEDLLDELTIDGKFTSVQIN